MYLVERAGSQPTIVFIHGYCQSSSYWAPTLERAAEAGARGLAPDLPGFASSAALPGPYTMEAYADAIAALLTAKGIARATVVGGSMGGVVAQHFALRHPALLGRLLLVATGGFTADPATALERAGQIEASDWGPEMVEPIVRGFFYRPPAEAKLGELRATALSAAKSAAVEAARSNAHSRTFERLGEIAAPTLIIQGRHDRSRTPEHGADMAAQMQNARCEVIEDAGHTVQLEQPAAFYKIAMPFLFGRDAPLAAHGSTAAAERIVTK